MNTPFTKTMLHRAILNGEIVTLYQPQVAGATGELSGVEALVRWAHPQLGLLTPSDFMASTEGDPELEQLIAETVLRQACRDAMNWGRLLVGVNISPVQFKLSDMADRLLAVVREEGIEPGRLEFEILESAYFEDPAHMRDTLVGLRTHGMRIALDDFGTGYSSLSALLELPLDKLKIDASFVQKAHTLRSAAIIHAVVALARAIGLKVTAEGVETVEQEKFLRAAGCHFLQGYLISKPLDAAGIAKLMTAGLSRAGHA